MIEKIILTCLYPPALDGSGYSNYEFARGLKKKGLDIQVIAQPCDGDKEYDAWSKEHLDIPIKRVPTELVYEGSPPPDNQLFRVNEFIKNFLLEQQALNKMPDLVVVGHDSWAWYNSLYKEFGLPIVQHLRGTPTRAITEGIYPEREKQLYLDSVFKADKIVTVSQHFADLISRLGYPEENISSVYNGTDLSLFKPMDQNMAIKSELGIPADARVIVHASNFCPVKRVHDIVDSADEVLSKYANVHYLLIGDGSEKSLIQEKINHSTYKNKFHMVGRISNTSMPDYLSIGDIFILSSENEGLPRATVEAQASGLYLIMSDCAAGIERTQNNTIGSTYRMGDASDLAVKTLAVLNMNEHQFKAIRENALDYVQNNCDFNAQLNNYLSVLNKVYSEHKVRTMTSSALVNAYELASEPLPEQFLEQLLKTA